jgi:hypothetical protein
LQARHGSDLQLRFHAQAKAPEAIGQHLCVARLHIKKNNVIAKHACPAVHNHAAFRRKHKALGTLAYREGCNVLAELALEP